MQETTPLPEVVALPDEASDDGLAEAESEPHVQFTSSLILMIQSFATVWPWLLRLGCYLFAVIACAQLSS